METAAYRDGAREDDYAEQRLPRNANVGNGLGQYPSGEKSMNYRVGNANLTRKEIKEIKRREAEERNAATKPEDRRANRIAK